MKTTFKEGKLTIGNQSIEFPYSSQLKNNTLEESELKKSIIRDGLMTDDGNAFFCVGIIGGTASAKDSNKDYIKVFVKIYDKNSNASHMISYPFNGSILSIYDFSDFGNFAKLNAEKILKWINK